MLATNHLMRSSFDWTTLVPCYHEPHRVYHDIRHVYEMIARAQASGVGENMPWMEAVIWLHDAHHDPAASHGQNELMSAALLDGSLGEAFTQEGKALARSAIEASARHFQDQVGLHSLIELFLDIDLGGLGGSDEDFKVYTQRVTQEHQRAGYTHEKIIQCHERFARAMLARKRIY